MPTPDEHLVSAVDSLAKQVGKQIKRARDLKNMSVTELHRETGISRTVLQGYEAGRYKPGAREILLLAEKLDCSPNRLLFGHDDFRKRSALDDLLGSTTTANNGARVGVMMQLLTIEEQRAFVNLLTIFVESKKNGKQLLADALRVSDQIIANLEADADGADSRLRAFAGEKLMDELEGNAPASPTKTGKPKRKA